MQPMLDEIKVAIRIAQGKYDALTMTSRPYRSFSSSVVCTEALGHICLVCAYDAWCLPRSVSEWRRGSKADRTAESNIIWMLRITT